MKESSVEKSKDYEIDELKVKKIVDEALEKWHKEYPREEIFAKVYSKDSALFFKKREAWSKLKYIIAEKLVKFLNDLFPGAIDKIYYTDIVGGEDATKIAEGQEISLITGRDLDLLILAEKNYLKLIGSVEKKLDSSFRKFLKDLPIAYEFIHNHNFVEFHLNDYWVERAIKSSFPHSEILL